MKTTFRALVVEENEPNVFTRSVKDRNIDDLPPGDVLIEVHYSSLNYKDALSARGHKGITRKYPHTPGVDAAGIVAESKSEKFKAGDKVIVTGYDLGMNTSGGFAEYIRVPAGWVVSLPDGMSLKESMFYGTAGFTAGISIFELEKHGVLPGSGKVLVTGATGGVGSLAIAMLSKAGYSVTASTGKVSAHEYLKQIGAKEIISREDVKDSSSRPLLSAKWAGAIDTVGGSTLTSVIRSIDRRGAVAACGLVESDKIEMTVYPFILRGVRLIGIDSAESDMNYRLKIWDKISKEWKLNNIDKMMKEVSLEGLSDEIDKILRGEQVGKVVVNLHS